MELCNTGDIRYKLGGHHHSEYVLKMVGLCKSWLDNIDPDCLIQYSAQEGDDPAPYITKRFAKSLIRSLLAKEDELREASKSCATKSLGFQVLKFPSEIEVIQGQLHLCPDPFESNRTTGPVKDYCHVIGQYCNMFRDAVQQKLPEIQQARSQFVGTQAHGAAGFFADTVSLEQLRGLDLGAVAETLEQQWYQASDPQGTA